MVRYRRSTIEGGVYFFTLTLKDRRSDILRVHISDFKRCYNKVKTQYPFKNLAYVVLPERGMLKENWADSEVLLLNCEYGE